MPASYLVKPSKTIYVNNFVTLTPNGIWDKTEGLKQSSELFSFAESDVTESLSEQIGNKGFRFHDRSSKLCLTVAKRCLCEGYSDKISVIVGSNGALQSQLKVVEDAMITPQFMNPKSYPNRGCNVIAGQISLFLGLRGESTVISANMRSGIDSLIYAIRKISQNHVPCLIVAGESMSLARERYTTFFEKRVPVEGAVAMLLGETPSCLDKNHILTVEGYLQVSLDMVTDYEQLIDSIKRHFSIKDDKMLVIYDTPVGINFSSSFFDVTRKHELFGATALLGIAETLAVMMPNISHYLVICKDYNNCISSVLLKRTYN